MAYNRRDGWHRFTEIHNLLKVINEKINDDQDIILEKILNVFRKNETLDSDKKTEIINLKPTKISEKQIIFIENNLINNTSISSFYRNLFTSYAHNPQNFRELIIFKKNYDLLTESIEKNRKVSITLKESNNFKVGWWVNLKNIKNQLTN